MFGSTHTKRLAKSVAVVLGVAALAVPAASAGDGLVDDWFRDTAPALVPQASIGLIDVTAQNVSRPIATLDTPAVATRLVDDWFRDAKPVAPQASIGPIDVTASESSRPLASPTVAAPVTTVAHTGDGFGWSEFGIGAVAMLGLMLLVGAFVLGAHAVRHRGGSLSTS